MALSLALPMLTAIFASEFDIAVRLGQYLVLGTFFCIAVLISVSSRRKMYNQVTGFVTTVALWTVTPIYLAIPLADMAGMNYLDALFEITSGLTTTGASTIIDLELLPRSLIFYRSQVQWTGGLLTMVTVILFLSPSRIGGLPDSQFSSVSRKNTWSGNERSFYVIAMITRIYLAMTISCFIALILAGQPPFEAATLAMMALSTGGFLPASGSLLTIAGQPALVVLSLFLIIGATSIFWQRMYIRGQIHGTSQRREGISIVVTIFILALVIAALLFRAAGSADVLPVYSALVEGLFNAASLVSTNGVETREGVFALLPVTLVLIVVMVGGGTFSTAGGMKHYRLRGMIAHSWHEVYRLIYPNAVRATGAASHRPDSEMQNAIWSYFGIAILVISLGMIVLNFTGLKFDAALVAAVSCFSNAGPLYNPAWGAQGEAGWPVYADLSVSAKITLMGLMVLGRIEVLVVLGSINLKYWLRR